MKTKISKFVLFAKVAFVSTFVFCMWIEQVNAAATDYTCEKEEICNAVCKKSAFTVEKHWYGDKYYCNHEGYSPGAVIDGSKCFKQEDCYSGSFCTYKNVCKKKYADEEACSTRANQEKMFWIKVSNGDQVPADCKNGCVSGFFRKHIASALGGITQLSDYRCGKGFSDSPGGPTSDDMVPGTPPNDSGIIQCGRSGQRMCHLCDLIKGLNDVIHYIMKVAIGFALLMICIGGVMIMVSSGETKLYSQGKDSIKYAIIGFIIIFSAYFIINTMITYLGAKTGPDGTPTFGMQITGWGTFDCNAGDR